MLDRVVNLVEEGIDVAVRIADLPDSSLHMLRVGEVRRVLTASPAYLATYGRPASLSDLRHHDVIRIEDEAGAHRGWGLDENRRFGRSARFSVNNMEAAVSAAVSGLGVVRTMSYQVADEIAAGRLELLLTDATAPTRPISLLFQSGRKKHPNGRAFIEAAKQHLQGASL